jgi:hypothetical protein
VSAGPPPELEQAIRIRGGRQEGKEIRFRCVFPDNHAHADADPSARYNPGKGVWICDACGESGRWKDLCERLGVRTDQHKSTARPRVVATYLYLTEKGIPLRRKLRWEPGFDGRPKSFSWEKPDGQGGWVKCKGDGNPPVLYGSEHLPQARRQGQTVFVVEGEKDCDRGRALGLVMVCNPEGASETETRPKWKPEYSRQLTGLPVVVIADKDKAGRAHARAVAQSLSTETSPIRVLELPGEGVKDLSNWVDECEKAGDSREKIRAGLEQLAQAAPVCERSEDVPVSTPQLLRYRRATEGMVHVKATRDGEVLVPLTNFDATILTELIHDNGVETQRSLEIEATHRGRSRRFTVSASQFQSLTWVTAELGPTAVVFAGSAIKDHARVAIQLLSPDVGSRTVYTHLGWRELSGHWTYLSATGPIGSSPSNSSVEVSLPEQLRLYELPIPPSGEALTQAIEASLGMIDLLPDPISIPIYCAIWRAVVGACDFTVHLAGRTGEGKSEFAALAQQHSGPRLDARHLPGSWTSTGNALEALAFSAKDALLVVDDFAPSGTTADVQRQHREAARLLRAQGNQSGRQRLRPDASLRPVQAPRGLVLSTGEDIPNAHSIRARTLILEVPVGAMNWKLLSSCQIAAAEGLYAQALSGFLRWLAPRYSEVRASRAGRLLELRQRATGAQDLHRRTPALVADLALGLELFVQFATEVGVLGTSDAQTLWDRAWSALLAAGEDQADHLTTADPVIRFLDLLRSALAAGRAHLASPQGDRPDAWEVWGWRKTTDEPLPLGDRIGWVQGEDLYLDPDVAYRIAQQMALHDGLAITSRTLWKRMQEVGLLAGVDTARGRNLLRVTLQRARRTVLHLRTGTLLAPEAAQPAQSAHSLNLPRGDGPVLWAGSRDEGREMAQPNGPEEPVGTSACEFPGPVGPIGPVPEVLSTTAEDVRGATAASAAIVEEQVKSDEWGEV